MTAYLTCRPCAINGACVIQSTIAKSIAGLRITSLHHRCSHMQPLYRPGQAVWIEVYDGYSGPDGREIKAWFPATFMYIAAGNSHGVAVVKAEAMDDHGEVAFQPKSGGAFGVCKVIWQRIKRRDAADEPMCSWCKLPPGVTGCQSVQCRSA